MTFMFQFPEFISIPLKSNVTKKYPNYSLFVYGEGAYAVSWQYPKITNSLTGIPVLFVPGNGGSYKQVRSFGSIALRMADDRLSPFTFDFFTINYNEELSGLNGDLLPGQTEFLYESIEAIKKIFVIITCTFKLVLPIDMSSTKFYDTVNQHWDKIRTEPQMSHLTVISINGGFNDKLVKNELTQLHSPLIENGDLSLSTSMIPDVWLSTDHLCIVWCRQLIIKLTRLLFDLIPKDGHKITSNMELRKKIIRYHLLHRTRSKSYPTYFIPETIDIPSIGNYVNALNRFHFYQKQKVLITTFILIPLMSKTTVLILASGLQKLDWIVACTAVTKKENQTETTIWRFYKQEASHLLNKGFDHILLYIAPTTGKVTIYSERYVSGRRNKAIVLPSLFQSLTSMIFSAITVLNIPITEESTFYNLTMVGIEQIWHSYWIKLEVSSCYPAASEMIYMHFWIPWSNEDTYTTVRPRKRLSAETVLKLDIAKPNSSDPRHPHIFLILDPYCGYVMKVKLSLPEVLGQIFRHYHHKLLPLVNAILLSILALQMKPQELKIQALAQNANLDLGSDYVRKVFPSIPIILKNCYKNLTLITV
ncbi:GPI inositol-deacylase-like protein [Dinothrombium tinctorium]|uniref:GPI inositol-deacylase-like protein n=1 Tax=Dinothrombium tinctorium TaxID=1965070 RepID=A0A3S3RWD5_9ACAR|nr:GPI inositol-deacylase-like protein [Dinothrombium tinctorium]